MDHAGIRPDLHGGRQLPDGSGGIGSEPRGRDPPSQGSDGFSGEMNPLMGTADKGLGPEKLLLESSVMESTQWSDRTNGLHGAEDAFCIMDRDSTIHHQVPAGRLQPGNLVWGTGDSHCDGIPEEAKVNDLLLWNEITLLPIQAPAQDHEQQSCNLSMEIGLVRRRSLDEDVIHINGDQDAPGHPQESHDRFEDLGQDPRTTFQREGPDTRTGNPDRTEIFGPLV